MNLEQLKKEYATQDNRATAYPFYVTVQEFKCIAIVHEHYSYCGVGEDEKVVYEKMMNCDNCDDMCEAMCNENDVKEKDCKEETLPVLYAWIDIEFFLTIKGAQEFMKFDAHNHGKLRTFIKWFNGRNYEMRELLKELGFKTQG